jgi:hypothetical protein
VRTEQPGLRMNLPIVREQAAKRVSRKLSSSS